MISSTKISSSLFYGAVMPWLLQWANRHFPLLCTLNSNPNVVKHTIRKQNGKSLDFILAAGTSCEVITERVPGFESLQNFFEKNKKRVVPGINKTGGIFGFLSYDLKNEIENLNSANYDGIKMPGLHFFVPDILISYNSDTLTIQSTQELSALAKELKKTILSENFTMVRKRKSLSGIRLSPRESKTEYVNKINRIKKHILRGDIYELNYCVEFFAENAEIDPVEVYIKQNEFSPMPFSAFYKFRDKYLVCSSPERFLKKAGNKIISQPIKGTIRRGKNSTEDRKLKFHLLNNRKEQSENVMIVDLVRNDLSKIAVDGSVKVNELYGIQTYPNLHHMISTVSCNLHDKFSLTDTIKNCFPMGSMTGAPKIKAMELIEKFERTKRGLFSGAVGYITGNGDFDFNVVIRSILYNAKNRYVSIMAGSAITASCDAEKEYRECLLKIKPMMKALGYDF